MDNDNNNNKRILSSLGINANTFRQASGLTKYAESLKNIKSITPRYGFITSINEPEYRDASEVIEEEEAEVDEHINFISAKCEMCNKSIDSRYYWYYLKHPNDGSKSFSLCCLKCLTEYWIYVNSVDTFFEQIMKSF